MVTHRRVVTSTILAATAAILMAMVFTGFGGASITTPVFAQGGNMTGGGGNVTGGNMTSSNMTDGGMGTTLPGTAP